MSKIKIIKKNDEYDEDGYQVVKDYIDSLDDRHKKNFF